MVEPPPPGYEPPPGFLDWIQWFTLPSVILALPTLIALTIYFVVRSRRSRG